MIHDNKFGPTAAATSHLASQMKAYEELEEEA
jgi:hypothetical protein